MAVSLQWLCAHVAVVRVHPEGSYGSPWSWCCTLHAVDGEAILYGALTCPSYVEAHAVKERLRGLGFKAVWWERVRNGRVHVARVKL